MRSYTCVYCTCPSWGGRGCVPQSSLHFRKLMTQLPPPLPGRALVVSFCLRFLTPRPRPWRASEAGCLSFFSSLVSRRCVLGRPSRHMTDGPVWTGEPLPPNRVRKDTRAQLHIALPLSLSMLPRSTSARAIRARHLKRCFFPPLVELRIEPHLQGLEFGPRFGTW